MSGVVLAAGSCRVVNDGVFSGREGKEAGEGTRVDSEKTDGWSGVREGGGQS